MPGILYVVHGLPPEEYTGTPLVAHSYAGGIARRGWDVTVVYGSSATATPEAESDTTEGFRRRPVVPEEPNGQLWAVESPARSADDKASAVFAEILDEVRPDVVHVVDNVGLPLTWPEQAAARGIPVVRTVSCAEDLCGLIAPVSPHSDPVGYCEAPLAAERCLPCIRAALSERWGDPVEPELPPGPPGALSRTMLDARKARLQRLLHAKRARAEQQFRSVFDVVLFSTPTWRAWFERTLPLAPGRGRVLDMGMELGGWPADRARRTRGDGEPMVIAWATTLDTARGVNDVVDAFLSEALLGRRDYRLVVLGGGDPNLIDPLAAANPCVEYRGRYEAQALPGILAGCDVGLSSSLFETFHRVTREYFLAGLPVIANPTFGTADILRHGDNALLYEHTAPGSLAAAVTTLLDDRALEDRLAAGAAATPVRSADEEIDELAGCYEELLAGTR